MEVQHAAYYYREHQPGLYSSRGRTQRFLTRALFGALDQCIPDCQRSIHLSLFFLGTREKPATILAAGVGEQLTGEELTTANWEKIEAYCFGDFSADDRDISIGRLRRQFKVVLTVEGRNGLLTAEIQKRQNEGGDPIANAEDITNNSEVHLRDQNPGLDDLDCDDSASQGGLPLPMGLSRVPLICTL
jgi:hypothetical protein